MSGHLHTDGARAALISTLDAYHGTDSSAALEGKGEPTDAFLVFERLVGCGKYESEQDLKLAIAQYTEGRPLAYITESHPFGNLTLTIRPPVYIPRIETEQWVLLLGQRIYSTLSASPSASPSTSSSSHTPTYTHARPFRILDICSGSGCIPLLLASLGKGLVQVVGLEVDDRALAVARENVDRNALGEVAKFEKFDLFDDGAEAMDDLKSRIGIEREQAGSGDGEAGVAGGNGTGKASGAGAAPREGEGKGASRQLKFGFDMVVSNPPYVSSEDMRKVEQTWYESRFALQGKLPVSRPALSGSEHHAGAASSTQQQQKTTPAPASGRGVGGENGDVQDGDDGYTFYRRIKSLYSIFLDEASSVGDAELASTLADTVCASSTSDSSSTSATPNPGNSNSANSDNALPKLVLEVGAKQSRPVQEMYASEGRLEVTKETARRREVGAPQLEQGDMVGTERSVWVYRP